MVSANLIRGEADACRSRTQYLWPPAMWGWDNNMQGGTNRLWIGNQTGLFKKLSTNLMARMKVEQWIFGLW